MKSGPLTTLAAITSQLWRESAACNGCDPRMWDDDGDDALTEAAVWRCRGCPTRVECLRDAIEHDDSHTIRGGLTAKERKGLSLDDLEHDLTGDPAA